MESDAAAVALRYPPEGCIAVVLRPLTGADERWLAEALQDRLSLAAIGNRLLARLAAPPAAARIPDFTLGDRERLLRRIAASLLGVTIERALACPDCGALLEVEVPLTGLDAPALPEAGLPSEHSAAVHRLRAADLERAAASPDPAAALMRAADPEGGLARDALAALVEAADPDADCRLETACPDCGAAAALTIDALALVVEALTADGGFLADLDTLARHYGWSEAEIVAMPRQRRRRYAALARAQG